MMGDINELVTANSNSFPDATIPTHGDSSYGFVVAVRPTGQAVSLRLQDICELDGSSIGLHSINRTALYAAINKNLNGLRVSPSSHTLSDWSRLIKDDDELREVVAFEREFGNLFRWFLDPIPGASVNDHPPILDSLAIPQNPQDTAVISSPNTTNQQASPTLSDAAGSSRGSLKHGPPDSPNGQGSTKKHKENPRVVIDITAEDDNHGEEEHVHVKGNADSADRDSDSESDNDGNDGIETAEALDFATAATPFEQTLNRSQTKFEQWALARWEETKRVYARSGEELSNNFKAFTQIPWCNRFIFPHQAYAAIFLIETECLKGGVLLADHVGIGKTATCWLALATISIGHEIRRTHGGCTTEGCIYKPENRVELFRPTRGIICPMASNALLSKKVPRTMTKLNLPTLIVAPSALVSVWKNEFQKTVLSGVLDLRTVHRDQHQTLGDLYTPYKTSDAKENDSRKDNVVLLTSKESLDKRIMAKKQYHHFLRKKGHKYPIRVGRLQFARVLVDEFHDIQGVNTTFFNNLVKLAADGASVWFISATPLPKGAKSLAGCMKCWDATAFTRQLRDPLASKLGEIDKAYNTAFRLHSAALANKQKKSIQSTRKSMDAEVEKLAAIMLDFTIQRRHETVFLKTNILHLPPTTKETCALEFQSDYWKGRYVAYYKKKMDAMRKFQVNIGENYFNVLTSGFEHMRKSRIYAGIPGLLDIPGQWTTEELLLARKKSAENSSSTVDSIRFIGQRVFDRSQIDMLVKSSKKLQRLIDLLYEWKTGEELPPFEVDGSSRSPEEPPRPPSKRKIAIFATYSVECEIIEWAIRDKTDFAVASLHSSLSPNLRDRLINDAFGGHDPVLSFVSVIVGPLHMLSKGLTLTKAQIAVMWAPQWLATTEQQAFGRISRIGQDRPTKFLRFIAKGTIEINVDDFQQQREGFDIRVLGVRLEGQQALYEEDDEEDDREDGDE